MKIQKLACLMLAIITLFSVSGCSNKKSTDFSDVKAICELATLKCYYHNTAELKKDASGIGKYIGKIGYKKAWIEYSGIVKLGIDASRVKITSPTDNNNVVKVYIPKAEILDVYCDSNSLSEPVSESGWFTSITAEEKASAYNEAQTDMRKTAENNESLKIQASQRAKDIFKNYIINVGKEIGIEYQVEWIEK